MIQRDIIVIPKSKTPLRIAENINIFDFELTDSEMKDLGELDKDLRLYDLHLTYGCPTKHIMNVVPYSKHFFPTGKMSKAIQIFLFIHLMIFKWDSKSMTRHHKQKNFGELTGLSDSTKNF